MIEKNKNNNSLFYSMKFENFNCFTANESPYNVKEIIQGQSLVDPTLKIPTLKEYVESYLITGHADFPANNKEEVDLPESDEFSPVDMRDVDIDDIREYSETLKQSIDDNKKAKSKASSTENVETSNNEKKTSSDADETSEK